MKSTEIRKQFLEFFRAKKHTIKSGSPLLPPPDDPTLLFTTAGMLQFKPLWAGAGLPFQRVATVQKCLRAGGKGSDLENVGKTLRHHTFFEMLGNFSFADYFKKEAITWAWEFLIDVLHLPPSRIWVSVYKNDEQAYSIWKDEIKLPPQRIIKLGDKDNFWGPAGVTGACGPSSEIYFDLGPETGCGRPECRPGCSCERYLEFWNLVFPQFYQQEDGSRRALERKGIDTGMGLERLAFIMQDKAGNNYETDLFKPIVDQLGSLAGIAYSGDLKPSFHVIADHIRALSFAINENIMPSNENRGYVLRRLLRRAVRHGRNLGIREPFLHKLTDTVADIMKIDYPDLIENRELISGVIRNEEERFQRTIDYGLYMLDEIVEKLKKGHKQVMRGKDIFKLYDTFGFPVDLLQELAEEKELALDLKGFEELMKEQKARARASWDGANQAKVSAVYKKIQKEYGEQKFAGYDNQKAKAKIIAIVQDDRQKEGVSSGDKAIIFLDRTPFYAESGGQTGDTGLLAADGGQAEVTNTKKILPGVMAHEVVITSGELKPGDELDAVVNKKRREAIARHHTATHLLQYALRQILGDHVKQFGSLVAPHKLRFDFTHFTGISPAELSKIEYLVNEKIMADQEVVTEEMALADAMNTEALAFFGEKYKEKVRVLNIGDYSKELCGGTHVARTGMIGLFRIISEGSVAAGVRRIEAVCGWEGLRVMNEERNRLEKINEIMKSDPATVVSMVEEIVNENRKIAKKYRQSVLEGKKITYMAEIKGGGLKTINGIRYFIRLEKDINAGLLRQLGDILIEEIKNGIVVLGGEEDGKVSLLVLVTGDLVSRGYHAGKIIKQIAYACGGTGGGKPHMAQGGTKTPELAGRVFREIIEKGVVPD